MVVQTSAKQTATVFVTDEEYKTAKATKIPPEACKIEIKTTSMVHPSKIFPFVS